MYNYGASLQAYALQHYLEQQGNNVEIIDFWPYFFQGRYNLFYVSKSSKYYKICMKYPIIRFFYGILANRGIFRTIGRKKSFDDFEVKYLHITLKRYTTSAELQSNPPEADMYIAGSDQIWNTNMPNGYEDAFYLDFGDDSVKRITYAASFGINEIPKEHKAYVYAKCKRINAISVRENSGIEILKQCNIQNAIHVLDPVFLLTDLDWYNIAKDAKDYKILKDKYILLYEFIGDEKIKNVALHCAETLNLKLVSVNDSIRLDYADININDAGPCEFVSLIANAALVITNSFHATAFSIILKRNFYSYSLASQKTFGRMAELCKMLGINNRFNNFQPDCLQIDYVSVDNILLQKQIESRNFLNKYLL